MEKKDLSAGISAAKSSGAFLLVDLADSTRFKSDHEESVWVPRLQVFYDLVTRVVRQDPRSKVKYVGDGILVFFPDRPGLVNETQQLALRLLDELHQFNQRGARDSRLAVRIILNYGNAYLFFDEDPQGSTVDKLFRMEKLVPNESIGYTQEFIDRLDGQSIPLAGAFQLKGLTSEKDAGRHKLYIAAANRATEATVLDERRKFSYATDLWWLPGIGDEPLYLVDGHVPPKESLPEGTVVALAPRGDKDAVIDALFALAHVGDVARVKHHRTPVRNAADLLQNHVVCIGGPYSNDITKSVLSAVQPNLGVVISESKARTVAVVNVGGRTKTFTTRVDDRGRLVEDWGFFARARNPFNRDAFVIAAFGGESPATAAVVDTFSPLHNPHFLRVMEWVETKVGRDDKGGLRDFACLIPFQIHPQDSRATMLVPEEFERATVWELAIRKT